MRGRRPATFFLSLAALLSGLLGAVHARAAEPPAERSGPVKELIRQADAALRRLDVARAREIWAEIYEIERSNAAMCRMGQLDARMARWELAAAELSQCIDDMPAPRTAAEREMYEQRHADLAAARRRVGEVQVVLPPGTVGMLVNGRGVKHVGRVYLSPGHHEVTAVGPEGQVARAGVKVEAGESKPVPLEFDKPAPLELDKPAKPAPAPEGRAQAPEPAPRLAAPEKPPQGPRQPGPDMRMVVTGTLASVGFLVTGVACFQSAQGYEQEASAAWDRAAVRRQFEPAFQPDYDELIDTAASGKLMRLLGTSSLIAGTAAGIATLVYVWLPNDTQIRVATHGAEVRVRW